MKPRFRLMGGAVGLTIASWACVLPPAAADPRSSLDDYRDLVKVSVERSSDRDTAQAERPADRQTGRAPRSVAQTATATLRRAKCPISWVTATARRDIVTPIPVCLPGATSNPPSEIDVRATIASTVTTAFQSLPIPKPVLGIQPPGGETLVNIDTIYSATARPFSHTMTLLGQQVTLDIAPTRFTWNHGDGTSQVTASGGRPITPSEAEAGIIPEVAIKHLYSTKGTVNVSVAVTWSATWRLGNGPTQPVPGTVTTQSPAQRLAILEARPQLVH